jgi:hypothetical protein
VICECCGMRLRAGPAARASKEKVRAKRRDEKIDYRGMFTRGQRVNVFTK